ncbi:MAG: DUF799 domain-containing protein [Marinifilaceae bacterium]|jgi:hypothetical protein|nr:DUF799 domain-containing protein [Marinifilaceae bacterium]
MNKYINLILGIIVTICFVSCSTSNTSLQELYPKMYKEKPLSILIMPPMNTTNKIDAKDFLYASLAKPLCNLGYYVFPPILTLDFLKSESAYNSEIFIESDLKKFHQYIGADAILFTKIKEWDKNALSGLVVVSVDYILKSTQTNEILFTNTIRFEVDNTPDKSSGSIIADMIGTAVGTALTSQMRVARTCVDQGLRVMPYGKYSPKYWK